MKNNFFTKTNILCLGIMILFLGFGKFAKAATFTAVKSGAWSAPATWGKTGSPTAGTNYPGASDAVVIDGSGVLPVTNYTVTVDITGAKCASVQLGTAVKGSGGITFSGTSDLTVSGTITLGAASTSSYSDAGTITMTSTSTLTANAIINGTSHNGVIDMSAGGTLTSASITDGSGGGTSTYTFSAGFVKTTGSFAMPTEATSFTNLEIVSGKITLAVNTTINTQLKIDANTEIADGGFTISLASAALVVNGKITGSGTISFATSTLDGTGSIGDKISIASGACSANATTNMKIYGSFTIANNITFTNNGTVNDSVSTGIVGSNNNSTWVNAGSSSLTLSGPLMGIGSLTANGGTNTVTYGYGGSTSHTIKGAAYFHLTINEGSGTASLSAATTVSGNLTIASGVLDVSSSNYGLTVKGDFLNAVTFTPRSGTLTLNGSGSQTIGGYNGGNSTGYNLFNLTIANTSGSGIVTMGVPINVSGTLTLTSSIFALGNNKLKLTNYPGGTFSSTNYFQTNGTGVLEMPVTHNASNTASSLLFPIGDGYDPIYINPSSAVGTATYDVGVNGAITDLYGQVIDNTHPNAGHFGHAVNATWSVNVTSGSANNTVITPVWNSTDELSGFATLRGTGHIYVAHRTVPGAPWPSTSGAWIPTSIGSPSTISGQFALTAPAINIGTGITYFGVGDDNSATSLPVTLVSFNANYENNEVNLNWATASEINNHYFNIERSTDGQNWQNIGQVAGHGNSLTTQNYFTTDNLAGIIPSGNIYYRLQQVDFNGETTYSMIRSVTINHVPAVVITTSPNPATSTMNISWTNMDNQDALLKLVNITGQTLYSENVSGTGIMHKQIDISTFPKGTYIIQIITNKNISTQTVLKN